MADHLRKMAAEGKDMDGMDIDLDELRANLSKYKGTVYIYILGQ